MIFDNTLLFSDGQAITATAASTNVIDLGATGTTAAGQVLGRDIGKGTRVPLSITITEAFNTLTSLTFTLQSDDNSGFSSAKTVCAQTVVLADLTLGKQIDFPDYIPQGANERYLRFNYTVAGSNPSTGKILAGVVAARQTAFVGGAG